MSSYSLQKSKTSSTKRPRENNEEQGFNDLQVRFSGSGGGDGGDARMEDPMVAIAPQPSGGSGIEQAVAVDVNTTPQGANMNEETPKTEVQVKISNL